MSMRRRLPSLSTRFALIRVVLPLLFVYLRHADLTGSSRSLLRTMATGERLWCDGHDLRQALEISIACELSASRGSVDVALPLAGAERASAALYPSVGRWSGAVREMYNSKEEMLKFTDRPLHQRNARL